jgi:hypothetical protein
MDDAYQPIIDRFTGSEVRGYFQQPNQLVLSLQEGPAFPSPGNSFWVCTLDGNWYVSTWAPRYYRVPDMAHLLSFCEAFVHFGDRAQGAVPKEFVDKYELQEVKDADFDKLWEAARPSE